jgi:hypothetical protein
MPLPEGFFEGRCRPDRTTDVGAERTGRDKARLTVARFACAADDLKEMLDCLALWPHQDKDPVREIYLIDQRDSGPVGRRRK